MWTSAIPISVLIPIRCGHGRRFYGTVVASELNETEYDLLNPGP